MMTVRKVSVQKIRPCSKCGEPVVRIKSKRGKVYEATVQQDGSVLVVIVKNNCVVEHRHI